MTLPMDELIGNLQTYELNRKKWTTMNKKKEKSIDLRTSSKNKVFKKEDEMN